MRFRLIETCFFFVKGCFQNMFYRSPYGVLAVIQPLFLLSLLTMVYGPRTELVSTSDGLTDAREIAGVTRMTRAETNPFSFHLQLVSWSGGN